MQWPEDVTTQPWFFLLNEPQKELFKQALFLLEREKSLPKDEGIRDYSFLVFSAAKVYEGFLKSFLYQINLIDERAYEAEQFRIGKALNPDLPTKYRNGEWVFDALANECGDEAAHFIWQAWKVTRNKVFHFNALASGYLTLLQAEERINLIKEAMNVAAKCDRGYKRDSDGE